MITPADELGYCLSTLHDFGSGGLNNSGADVLYQSSDAAKLLGLISGHANPGVTSIDLTSFAETSILAGIGRSSQAADLSGNLYVDGVGVPVTPWPIAKYTSTGTLIADPWVTIPNCTAITGGIVLGRDGNLYVLGTTNAPFLPTETVWQITLTGTVTEIVALRADHSVSDEFYANSLDPPSLFGGTSVACASDGTVWVTVVQPSTANPNYLVNTLLRRAVPAGGGAYTVTDVPIQTIVTTLHDHTSNAWAGLYVDHADHVLVPMITYQGNGTSTANLSWVLRVTPSGTATRIAGTWDYSGVPAPAASATNIADGPLNVSLCCEVDNGCGISSDGKTLYFVDDGDQNHSMSGNLLRTLALCSSRALWHYGGVQSEMASRPLWDVGHPRVM